MYRVNEDYLKLPGSYLFSTIGKKSRAFKEAHPEADVISLGIGDVTQPLVPAIIKALHEAVDDMSRAETFHGYSPDLGYSWLRETIAKNDYAVYVDSNVMAGRCGTYDPKTERWSDVIYMPCVAENNFTPELPKQEPDIIYLCYPNNPTGASITKERLSEWVDYANRIGAVIIYDAAYEAYISAPDVPHSIYECEGARSCAIEIRSFSKNAGFTGTRLGFTVVPKDLERGGVKLHSLWARRHGTKFNGAPYIVQKAAMAVYSEEGKKELKEQVGYYKRNCRVIMDALKESGYEVYGGVDAPYIWMKTPDQMTSWEFFDRLLEQAHVVGTPGSGFGPSGEHYFRLTAFGTYENTKEAVRRIQRM